ncbi:Na/Pi cotransporter family protein [Cerasicoccus fimbriatus]|uniref:Na/Pi cotransporter family protein n=1 Tax=Cerasicoccus fimbriatus TaxID=3014554 RepID=UPI0022B3F27B|nr:Na/Pi symporter [Cerasicoccus sp. TK19100]
MTAQFLNILAGLGLFFVGIKMLGKNLRAMASGPFRKLARKMSANACVAAFWGGVSGFATQSGRTTSLILASLVQGRIVDVRSAMPLVLWANFGCTLIVFAAVFPIDYLVLFALGITGICTAFEKPVKWKNVMAAIFGLSLMLFGLHEISQAAKEFTHYSWFEHSMELMNKSFIMAFLIGLVLTVICQSHMAIILITLAMTASGFFDFEHAIMVVYGTHVGSSVITYLTGAHFKGRAAQVVWGQVLYNLVAVAIFLSLFIFEMVGKTELLHSWVREWSDKPDMQVALVTLLMNVVTPVALTLVAGRFTALCEKSSPPTQTEHLSQPEYLQEDSKDSPMAGLMLCEKEQLRLLQRLPNYLATLREGEASLGVSPAAYHQAYSEISRQILHFQSAMITHSLSAEHTEWLINLQNRQDLLNTIEGACYSLCKELGEQQASPEIHQLSQQIIEALDTMILTAIAALEEYDASECVLLETMTAERGESMEQIRRRYLASADQVSAGMRNQVMHITNVFERASWALGRFGKLIANSDRMEAKES